MPHMGRCRTDEQKNAIQNVHFVTDAPEQFLFQGVLQWVREVCELPEGAPPGAQMTLPELHEPSALGPVVHKVAANLCGRLPLQMAVWNPQAPDDAVHMQLPENARPAARADFDFSGWVHGGQPPLEFPTSEVPLPLWKLVPPPHLPTAPFWRCPNRARPRAGARCSGELQTLTQLHSQ